MNTADLGWNEGGAMRRSEVEHGLLEALHRERRHAAVMFLATGIALGIAFSRVLDLAFAAS